MFGLLMFLITIGFQDVSTIKSPIREGRTDEDREKHQSGYPTRRLRITIAASRNGSDSCSHYRNSGGNVILRQWYCFLHFTKNV
jgi:hypothetical protein